jgi:trigger factor
MLSRGYEAPAYTYQKMKLFDQLESTLDFDVPASLLKKELDGLKGQISQFKDEDPELKGKSPKELEAYSEKVALRRVRIGLMLADYADKNQLKPTSDDFRSAIMTQARAYPGSEQQIFEFYQNNKQALQSLSGPILEDKAVRHILETQVKAAEKEYTAEAFAKLVEDLED